MSSYTSIAIRCSLIVLTSALLLAGCSGSSSTDSNDAQPPSNAMGSSTEGMASNTDLLGTNGGEPPADANVPESNGSGVPSDDGANSVDNETEGGTTGNTTTPSPEEPTTTQVNVDITVPVYVSNALQVRVEWGDINTTAMWNSDEHWTASANFPVDTTHQLLVTFSDNNGAITLGTVEMPFSTARNSSENVQITANDFDIAQWDSDGDGTSNLDELLAGTNPEGGEVPEQIQANLELVQDKTFRFTWQSSPTADYYRLFEKRELFARFEVVADNIDATVQSYDHRVALYKRSNAEYYIKACNSTGCSDSNVMTVTGTLEQAVGYFKASNAKGGLLDYSHGNPIAIGADHFGSSVQLSSDGNTLVMAATGEDSGATGVNGSQEDNSVIDSGAVYVFARVDGQWQQQAYLKASNTDESDHFGQSLSLSADGNTLAVGVLTEASVAQGINGDQTDNSAHNSGAVYVFVRSDGSWRQQSYIKASNSEAGDQFGRTIGISGDGNTLVVSARYEDGSGRTVNSAKDNEGAGNGAAYVFTRSGESWSEQAYLKSSNSDTTDNFGTAVSISGDGNTIAVSAYGEASISTGINGNQEDNSGHTVGAVYVFTRSGETWQQEAYIKGSAYRNSYAFGQHALSLSGDGNTLAVGVWTDPNVLNGLDSEQVNGVVGYSGTVYIFARSNGEWQQEKFLKAGNLQYNGLFGSSVSLSNDGNTLAVGSTGEAGAATGINGDQFNKLVIYVGAAYVFDRDGGNWRQLAYVKATNTEAYDGFARSISLSGDGNTLAVGASSEGSDATGINGDQNNNSAPASGAVYLY